MDLEQILKHIHSLNPWSLALLVIGYAIARIPPFLIQKEAHAVSARDNLIKMLEQRIVDLHAENKNLRDEVDELKDKGQS